MFDIWIGEQNLTILMIMFSAIVVLPVQLLFCFKGKTRAVRFIPIILFSVLLIAAIIMYFMASGWNGLFYIVGAIYAVFMLIVCGIGWGIRAIVNMIKNRLTIKSQV